MLRAAYMAASWDSDNTPVTEVSAVACTYPGRGCMGPSGFWLAASHVRRRQSDLSAATIVQHITILQPVASCNLSRYCRFCMLLHGPLAMGYLAVCSSSPFSH